MLLPQEQRFSVKFAARPPRCHSISASGTCGGCLVGAGAMLQVGDLINQNLLPCFSRQCFKLICFCPSSFQLKWMLVLVVVHVVLVLAPLEEEGGGSQAGFGSGLLTEC